MVLINPYTAGTDKHQCCLIGHWRPAHSEQQHKISSCDLSNLFVLYFFLPPRVCININHYDLLIMCFHNIVFNEAAFENKVESTFSLHEKKKSWILKAIVFLQCEWKRAVWWIHKELFIPAHHHVSHFSQKNDTFQCPCAALTRQRWSNCTVVGFSNTFFKVGENARRSSGIQRSPIFGKELYTNPASSPATNAPTKHILSVISHITFMFLNILLTFL